MDEPSEVEGKRRKRRASRKQGGRGKARGRPHAYPPGLRRRAVQLCLEEGFPVAQVARDVGVSVSTLGNWCRAYRTQGEAGLQAKARGRPPQPQVAPAVKAEVVALKRRHPEFGIQRISQF